MTPSIGHLSNPWRRPRGRVSWIAAIVVAMPLAACSTGEPSSEDAVAERKLIVIDLDGHQTTIAAADLIDPETGRPAARQIWVMDRRSRQATWIPAQDFVDQPPAAPRFVPLAEPPPAAH